MDAILFKDKNFAGEHKHCFGGLPPADLESGFRRKVSSAAIFDGKIWEFGRYSWMTGPSYPIPTPPGWSPFAYLGRQIGSANAAGYRDLALMSFDDAIVTFRRVDSPGPSESPNYTAERDLPAHIILFEGDAFTGRHKHVVWDERDLSVDAFGSVAKSAVVLYGNWTLHEQKDFSGRSFAVGAGLYTGLPFKPLSVKGPSVPVPPPSNATGYVPEVILFEHEHFEGRHVHVFQSRSLAPDFQSIASSAAVIGLKSWQLVSDATPRTLSQGLYGSLAGVGIPNDSVTAVALI